MTGIEVLIGAVAPVLIEFVNRYIKSTNGKFIVSLLLPLIGGVALNFKELKMGDVESILASGTVMFTSAQAVYKLYFRDSVLQKRISG